MLNSIKCRCRRWPVIAGVVFALLQLAFVLNAQSPCIPYTTGIPKLYALYYVSVASANGDRLVVGKIDIPTFSDLLTYPPLPTVPNQKFCGLVNVAPGVLAQMYVPTAIERSGNFQNSPGLLIDPFTNRPMPGGIIPMSRIGDLFAFRIFGQPTHQQPSFAIVNAASGKVLDVKDLSSEDGALLQQWDYLGGANQQWLPQTTPGDAALGVAPAHYGLVNFWSGMDVDVTDESTSDGAPIQQWTNLNGANQQWEFDRVDDLHYKILNKLSGLVLDVRDSSTVNGAPIQQWSYLGNENQKWQFVPVIKYKIISQESQKALDVRNYSVDNGAPIQQWDYVGGANQQWLLIPVDEHYFRIENVLSHKVLDVTGLSRADGAAIQQWDALGSDNQSWQLLSVDGQNYEIVNKLSGKALDVRDYSLDNGGDIQQFDYLGGSNQHWQIVPLVGMNQ
jgi:hypothetical protein